MKLRTKLVVLLLLPLAVVFTTLGYMQHVAMRDAAITAAKEHTLLLTQATASEIESELAKAVHVAQTGAVVLAETPEISGDRAWSMLYSLVQRIPLVEGASIAWTPEHVSADGPAAPYVWRRDGTMHHQDLRVAYEEQGGAPYTEREWYQMAATGNSGWTPPYEGPVFDGLLVSYSVPVVREGSVVAVLSLDVPLVPLQAQLAVGEFAKASGYLVGPGDRFISNPDPKLIMQPVSISGGPTHLASAESGTLLQTADWPDGEPHIVAFEPIPTADWIFAAAIPEQDVLGPVIRQLAWNVGVLVIGGVVMACIVLVMGLRLTGDVRRLGSAVARVTAGELNATVEHIHRRDELGTLAQDFNTMTRQLEDTVAEAAEEVAARLAVERELDVAREIQAEMLPHEYPVLPAHPEVDLFAINVPARHVAGDFYDYWVQGDVLTAVLADVAGSGMPAALVMVRAMTLLRMFDDPDVPLTEVVAKSNAELCDENDRQIFVTGVVVRYNLTNGSFELVSAGHLPALICCGGEVSEEGDSTGPLLGVIPDGTWTSRCGTLQAGEWLSFYTDGITEARNASGAMLGTEGLREGLQANQAKDAQVLSNQGIAIAEHWHGGHVEDDLSMLVLRRT